MSNLLRFGGVLWFIRGVVSALARVFRSAGKRAGPHRRANFAATCTALAICAIVPATASAAAETRARPNIIFILADDLGYSDLGCYGQKRIQTPHLDRLATQGMRFTQFYAGSSVCAPSRNVLMTGQHTGHTTIRGNAKINLRADEVTIARVLKSAGYATGAIGKWGLGQTGSSGYPLKQGFDYFFGYVNQTMAHNYYPTYLVRNEQRVPLRNVVPNPGPGRSRRGIGEDRLFGRSFR